MALDRRGQLLGQLEIIELCFSIGSNHLEPQFNGARLHHYYPILIHCVLSSIFNQLACSSALVLTVAGRRVGSSQPAGFQIWIREQLPVAGQRQEPPAGSVAQRNSPLSR